MGMFVRSYILVISCKIVSKHIFSQFCNLLKFSSKNFKICPIKREESRHLQAKKLKIDMVKRAINNMLPRVQNHLAGRGLGSKKI